MSALAGRHLPTRQRGAALLIFLILVVTAALTYTVTSLTPEVIEALRMQKNRGSLTVARQALLWYAATFRDRMDKSKIDAGQAPTHYAYGYLPLPDLGTDNNNNIDPNCHEDADTSKPKLEGCDANPDNYTFNKTIIGRFPWQLFGTGPLRDGHGECLWYAVSGSHRRTTDANKLNPVINWDTLGQIDIVTLDDANPAKLRSLLTSAHDQPIAIIFSPGPPLTGQDRTANDGNLVTQCGGNYNPKNYLDPSLEIATTDNSYFSGSFLTETSTSETPPTPPNKLLAFATQGRIYSEGSVYRRACTPNSTRTCTEVANDVGLDAKPIDVFAQVRNNTYFRQDINSLLDRMVSCLRDTTAPTLASKVPASACYADTVDPQNYFAHYSEMIFLSPLSKNDDDADGQPDGKINGNTDCNGVLLFAGQRGTKPDGSKQMRSSIAEKADYANYLEDINLTSLTNDKKTFTGPEIFERVSTTQTAAQDIVRCIPNTPNFVTETSTAQALLDAGVSPLASYDTSTQTLTLGQTISSSLDSALAGYLYACAWKPDTHAMGSGLRSYFKFRINDSGFSSSPAEGIVFAIVDGDNNDTTACGAARQHLGYSGDNGASAFIVPPKIGFEIDTRSSRNQNSDADLASFYFDETASDPLSNGRNDPTHSSASTSTPKYPGGHVAFVYWGGDSTIGSLDREEDDNVHNHPITHDASHYTLGRTGYPTPPANPPIPWPIATQQGAYKLDPNLSAVPTTLNQTYPDFHVRVELTRSSTVTLAKARVATTSAIADLNAPGITAIDNVYLITNDRVLVKNQTDARENGIYLWNGNASAMTRASDFDSTLELDGAVVEISQGATNARSLWHQTTASPTVGTSSIDWHDLRVKVATQSNIASIATMAAGSTIDGIRMKTGDRVLVKAQTTASENGVYTWQSAVAALSPVAAVSGTVVQVQQGSDASGLWRYNGSTWSRQSIRVATQSNITLTAPGAAIDGITMAAGDLVLVKSQTTASENGLYTWTGAATAMTAATWPAGGLMQVLEGTDAGRAFRQSGTTTWLSIDGSPSYTLEAWILQDSPSDSLSIAALKNTTRPMSLLKPGFTAHLRTTPKIPYPFRNVRLGFTTGQRTSTMDQNFSINNAFTTWID